MLIKYNVNRLKTRKLKMDILTNSEDPDEMPHNAAFHQGLYCFLRQKQSPEKIQFSLEIIMWHPSIYIMDHPKCIVLNQKEEFISIQAVK